MNKKALSLAITLAMALPTTVSNALSLGDIESNSSLNQPFRGKINLLSTSAAEAKNLRVRVASPEVFNRVGIDRPAFLNSIRFRTTVQNGRPVILVSSNQPINEPFLNFLLEVSWPNGQLLKEYTVLLDPPVLLRADTAIASNNAGVRAEPKAQGRITRPVARTPQMTQQQRVAQQRRQAQAQRQVQAQRQAQQARRAPQTAAQKFAADARRVLAQQTQQRVRATNASSARTYRVRRGDTLSKVAKRLGYRGIRSEQMMIALFEKNRRAFTSNNINNLKSGVLLKRPSLQEARALNSKRAKAQIVAQAREWKKARGTAIASKGSGSKSATQVASNQQARMTVAGTNDSVSNNAGESGKADIAALNQKLMLTNESLTSKQKENEELKSRVSELESLLRNKNRLITLKSEQLAKLQEVAAGTSPQSEGQIPEVAQIEASTSTSAEEVTNGTDLQDQIANELAGDEGVIVRPQNPEAVVPEIEITPAVEPVAVAEPAEVAQQAPAFADEVVEPKTDILSMLQSPVVLGSGALLGLLGLGGMWYMRRRKDTDYEEFGSIEIDNGMDDADIDDTVEEFDLDDSMIDTSEFVAHDDIIQEPVEEDIDLTADNGEEDVLQEADVYIVYGLHDQAESELKQAIDKNPDNMAYRAKLLENYKAAGDVESFEVEAKAFINHESKDKEKYLEDIAEWGRTLNPASNLFSGAVAGIAGAAGVAMVAGTALADDVSEDIDIDIDGLDLDDDLEDFNLDDILSENVGDDDFDAEASLAGDQFEEIGSIEMDEVDSLDDLLDASDDLDFPEGLDFAELNTDIKSDSSSDLDTALDIDFGTDLKDDLETDLVADLDDDLDITNLSLDIDSEDFDKIMPEDNAYKASSNESNESNEIDALSDNDFEDNLLADFDDNLSFLDLDDDEADVIEETQIDTKLDLAKAYIDMGDIEGARSTLEEVMQDGSDDQKRAAEELLHSTG